MSAERRPSGCRGRDNSPSYPVESADCAERPGLRRNIVATGYDVGVSRTSRTALLDLDSATVRRARTLARQAGRPVVEIARRHTTVSVERATLRLA
ncbi:lysine 5,6-aminomutase subunit alpha TIM-barrel domain-containing protein, partial [Lapillicoccus sp.]|uniref:lysine 5,6-aminomutase subunit alpha TIM-barrel domain-containing protein n=1 Tax=Lapillicoccus sp. TaxID=1909287 RepID=UPI003266A6A4